MPELAAAHVLARDGEPQAARRFPWMLGAGLGVLAVAGLLAYPFAQADPPNAASPAPTLVPTEPTQPTRVAAETKLMAPALIEPAAGKASRKAVPAKLAATNTAGPLVAQPRIAPTPRDTALAVAHPISSRDLVVGDGRSTIPTTEAQAPQPAAEPADRWQSLRDALAACEAQGGLFARAACEQRARIAGCDSHWGEVALCPQARNDERR